MKSFSILVFGILLGVACSSAPEILHRKLEARTYRFAEDFEATNPTGKLTYRYCAKYQWFNNGNSTKCKIWITDIQDVCKADIHKKFRDANFRIVQEANIK